MGLDEAVGYVKEVVQRALNDEGLNELLENEAAVRSPGVPGEDLAFDGIYNSLERHIIATALAELGSHVLRNGRDW